MVTTFSTLPDLPEGARAAVVAPARKKVGHSVMPSLLIWTGPPPHPGLGAGLEEVTTLIYGCDFQLFLLPYILLFQDGQDLMIVHTKMKGGMPTDVTPRSLLSIMNNRGKGEAGGKLGLARQDATLVDGNSREKVAGRGRARKWRWCEHKRPHTRQQHAQAANKREGTMPRYLEEPPAGSAGANPQVWQEKQCREQKPSKKRKVVQGTSASLDQTPALAAGLLRQCRDALAESKTSLGREKWPAKGILPLVSIKQGGI